MSMAFEPHVTVFDNVDCQDVTFTAIDFTYDHAGDVYSSAQPARCLTTTGSRVNDGAT